MAKVYNTDELIVIAIKSVGKGANAVQAAAVGILIDVEKCNDKETAMKRINTLVTGVEKTVRAKSLVAWFAKFGGFTSSDQKGFDGWKGRAYVRENFEAAKKTMWNEVVKAENAWKGLDLKQAALVLLKRVDEGKKHVAAHPEDADKYKVSEGQVELLKQLAAA